MIDIHHHLLFDLDDGADTMETSLAMARMAAEDGITHIACTPHASERYDFRPQENAARLALLQQQVTEQLGGKLTLGLGCDFHLSFDNIEDALAHPRKYTINQKTYLLIEFPNLGIFPSMPDTVYQFVLAGLTPVVTHPERNLTFLEYPEKLADYLRIGCFIQITAGSLTGAFGKSPERAARMLLDRDWVHFIATDAHNLDRRPPKLSPARALVARHYGEDRAQRLFITNPRAAFDGAEMPEQPRTLDDEDEAAKNSRSFLSKLFSR